MIDPNILIFAIGLLLVIIEIILGVDTAFDFVVIGSALILGSLTGYYYDSFIITVATSTVLSFLYLLIGRKYLRAKLEVQLNPTNVDSLIGETSNLNTWDAKRKIGRIRIKGEEWRVTSEQKLKQNDEVVVKDIEGVTLLVKKSAKK